LESYLRAFIAAFALMIAVLASLTQVRAADGGTIDGWKLQQWKREDGIIDVYLCKTAVRIVIPKNGLNVQASAPWKEACLYCTKTNNIFKTPLAKFRNPYLSTMAIFDGGSITDIPLALKGPTKHLGIPCVSYVDVPGFSQRQMAKKKNGSITDRAPLTFNYVVSDNFKVDPEIGHLMSAFYAMPRTTSVPLQFTLTNVILEPGAELKTSSCKKLKLKASDFKLPPGLKEVKESMAVLVPDNSDGSLDLLMMGRSKVK
jgi:hypothetical protein